MEFLDIFTHIDSLIIFGTGVCVALAMFSGALWKQRKHVGKIAIGFGIAALVLLFGGKYYLDTLEWKEKIEIIETDMYQGLKFSKPMKIKVITRYRKGCLYTNTTYELLSDCNKK